MATTEGYVFDMGPSWYWMPGVFERFFGDFGKRVSDLYELKLLDPGFEVVFGPGRALSIPADFGELQQLFEKLEPGSGKKLDAFMDEAKFKYETGMERLVYQPGLSLMEFADRHLLSGVFRLQVFSPFRRHVKKYFNHPWLTKLMEFPVLFLGAAPDDTPALYSLMNYAGLKLGTWYPKGGFGAVVDAMVQVGMELGVKFHYGAAVESIAALNGVASGIVVDGMQIGFDGVIASADYHHVDRQLLPAAYSNYSESYWQRRTFAPSCLIFYVGLKKRISSIRHHTLFFDGDFDGHSDAIYKDAKWPESPLFYACCPSQTDDTVAPPGHENLFLLMPIAPGLRDSKDLRDRYFTIMMGRLEEHCGERLVPYVDFKRSYCVEDFITDYHSYKGNAYGLANTLRQTAVLKPKIRNKKIDNLFYAGQLTVPGPGVPPALVSGKISAGLLIKYLKEKNEVAL
jgi:phytoene desaturase